MNIYLAPMEGVVDPIMRALLTSVGGIDRCVTEFVRVSQQTLPPRVFYRLSPELYQGGKTPAGTPVYIQLLGSEPEVMAANAFRAAKLGAPGIDINFGCPAKTVNRNRGGSVLLNEPQLVGDIVAAVRKAVPADTPVTAKMRLGFEDKSLALDNAQAIDQAGATELCVHARTKVEGYRPPAHWHWIAKIKASVRLPVIANGDVFSPHDLKNCIKHSNCTDVMLGRGLLQQPDLALHGRAVIEGQADYCPLDWANVSPLLPGFFDQIRLQLAPKYSHGRLKQWLSFLKKSYPEAAVLFDQVKTLSDIGEIQRLLSHQCKGLPETNWPQICYQNIDELKAVI